MPTPIENRLARVRRTLIDQNLDVLLVLVEENRRYLSGFTGEDSQFDESAGALLISADHCMLATDSRYTLQAETEAPLFEIVCCTEGLAKNLPPLLKKAGVKRLGFESARMSYSQYHKIHAHLQADGAGVELIAAENIVENLRVIKEASEIDSTREALRLAEKVFCRFQEDLTPGMSEKEAAWAMEKGMREAGAEGLSFPTIVASGPNSALPHAIPGDRQIQAGEPLLFDWGARVNGYCSDISRTLVIGKPDATFRRIYQTVLDAQHKAIDTIRAGVSGQTVDSVARRHIEAEGFKGRFGHGLGHGTGLAIHELPRLSPLKDHRLEAGMICTVEPGIYIPGWGGVRIENMVVVREGGAEVLNENPPVGLPVGS